MDFENILSAVQPFVIMFAALLGAFLTAMWIAVVIWAFRDIRSRSRDIFAQILATLMVLIFFPLFPLPGLVLYMILRPRETLSEIYERSLEEEALLQGIEERMACPGCNRRIEEEFMICPTCHTRLKKACPACGRLLHLRWNICAYCGAVQTAAKTAPSLAEPVSLAVEAPASPLRLSELSASPDGGLQAQREADARPGPDLQPQDEPWDEPEARPWATAQTRAEPEEVEPVESGADPGAEVAPEPGPGQEPEVEVEPAAEPELQSQAEAEADEEWIEQDAQPDQEDEAETLSQISE
ncbi:MAG: zinc ribbon domain-containing protein [Anaerolineae bacterium]|nr:zinc ribbon domain-containing protein [Anaerolineae bacterium]